MEAAWQQSTPRPAPRPMDCASRRRRGRGELGRRRGWDAGATDAPLLQRLQDFLGVAGLVDPYEQQQQQVRLRRESGSSPVGYGSRERQARQAQQAQQAQRGGAADTAGAAAGPRPYFWRLAAGQDACAPPCTPVELPRSARTTLRRPTSVQDLWAVPLSSHVPRISLGSGSPQERRLTGAAPALAAGWQ